MMNSITYSHTCEPASAKKAKTEAFHQRLANLYPCADDVTKLPQNWSAESKSSSIALHDNQFGCYFKGIGRREDDEKTAAAVRTDHHIPQSCLLYYFEVKIISKGREGFIGIGLTSQFSHTKLPGWSNSSYGYHADDGNIFCGDGRGIPYGEKFSTNDIVGCGYNLVEGKCFFTKNGLNLGTAFNEMPKNVHFYPTVGLKTPGEEIIANFGQEEFAYKSIEEDMICLRKKITANISEQPIADFSNWRNTIHQLIQSWLIQNSYPNTAEIFTRSAKLECKENLQHVHQRHRIQQLVLSGRISEAIRLTDRLYPNLLQENPNLLFTLNCRQFVELISGAEQDYQPSLESKNNLQTSSIDINGLHQQTITNETLNGDYEPSSKSAHNNSNNNNSSSSSNNNNNNNGRNGMISSDHGGDKIQVNNQRSNSSSSLQELMDIDQPITSSSANAIENHNHHNNNSNNSHHQHQHHRSSTTGNSNHSSQQTLKSDTNGNNAQTIPALDTENVQETEQKFGRLIQFGLELTDYLQQLEKIYGKNDQNEEMLHEALGLLAYRNPETSCHAKLFEPSEREPISQLLNTSILKAELGDSYRSPMEEVVNHLRKLVRLNDSHGRWMVERLY